MLAVDYPNIIFSLELLTMTASLIPRANKTVKYVPSFILMIRVSHMHKSSVYLRILNLKNEKTQKCFYSIFTSPKQLIGSKDATHNLPALSSVA